MFIFIKFPFNYLNFNNDKILFGPKNSVIR